MTRCMSPVEVLPGGAVDPGEGTHAAGLRELYEETGLAPSSTKIPPGPFAMWSIASLAINCTLAWIPKFIFCILGSLHIRSY